MKKIVILASLLFVIVLGLNAQKQQRNEISIPDVGGYKTLKCDFHIHTVFSDGKVWPDVRVMEAWNEGLDAIAITEHLEYRPHENDIKADHNRSYDIAAKAGEKFDIIVIRGTEVTRKKPMGHINAIFTKDNNLIANVDSIESLKEAKKQGAFIFWNHPSEKYGKWSATQDFLYKEKLFQGIEIVNSSRYYDDAFAWCNDKSLTIMGNSDVHLPIDHDYDLLGNNHRSLTLVFAKEKTEAAIQEALVAGRTAVLFNHQLMGKEIYVKEIFTKSIEILPQHKLFKKSIRNKSLLMIKNTSGIEFSIKTKSTNTEIKISTSMVLKPNAVSYIEFEYNPSEMGAKEIAIPLEIENILVGPSKKFETSIQLRLITE